MSNRPVSDLPKFSLLKIEGLDKIVHAVFYLVLVLLMSYAYKKQHETNTLRHLGFIVLFSFFWGCLMELSQLFIFTYRSAEWADVIANLSGTLLAFLISLYIYRKSIVRS